MLLRRLTRARDELMERRYAVTHAHKPIRKAFWGCHGGRWRMLTGQCSAHLSRSGRMYRLRIRLLRRFGLSAFKGDNA